MRAVVASFRVVLPLAFFAAIPMAVAAAQSVSMVEAFQPGERLTFEGRFGIIRLGEASMTVLPDDTIMGSPNISLNLCRLYRKTSSSIT